jgi:hypothetical protein
MEFSVQIPTDRDGFLRRECPTCSGQFKWHYGPIDDSAAAELPVQSYFCPLCGTSARADQWWTIEQVEYLQASAMPEALRQIEAETRGLTVTDSVGAPPALTEPNDMQTIVPPCHDYEPVKVPDVDNGLFYCLVCGGEYAV